MEKLNFFSYTIKKIQGEFSFWPLKQTVGKCDGVQLCSSKTLTHIVSECGGVYFWRSKKIPTLTKIEAEFGAGWL